MIDTSKYIIHFAKNTTIIVMGFCVKCGCSHYEQKE